jgi:Na+/proline symporter
MSEKHITPPLSPAVGYGVVIGIGFLFAFGMILTTFVLKRYNSELQTSEMFSTAGRTVKSGLVSAAVVSVSVCSIAFTES